MLPRTAREIYLTAIGVTAGAMIGFEIALRIYGLH